MKQQRKLLVAVMGAVCLFAQPVLAAGSGDALESAFRVRQEASGSEMRYKSQVAREVRWWYPVRKRFRLRQ